MVIEQQPLTQRERIRGWLKSRSDNQDSEGWIPVTVEQLTIEFQAHRPSLTTMLWQMVRDGEVETQQQPIRTSGGISRGITALRFTPPGTPAPVKRPRRERDSRHGRTRAQQEAIDRYWKGLPLRDADDSVLFVVSQEDIANAKPGDPESCAIALTCKRTLGSTAVVIFHHVAYIDLPQPNGTRAILRFSIPPDTAEVIEALDSGRPPRPGTYRFTSPRGSHRLDAQLKWAQENRDKRNEVGRRYAARRKSIINGEITSTRGNRILSLGDSGYVRSGTGMVHMTIPAEKRDA